MDTAIESAPISNTWTSLHVGDEQSSRDMEAVSLRLLDVNRVSVHTTECALTSNIPGQCRCVVFYGSNAYCPERFVYVFEA